MSGTKVTIENGKINVPNDSIILFINGDGIDSNIWAASIRISDAAMINF